ncbi:hypothetical protein AB9E34_34270, partial [Rhizobium leguminosarum]
LAQNRVLAAPVGFDQQRLALSPGGKLVQRKAPQIPWLRQISGRDDVIIGAQTVQESGTKLIDAVLIHFDSSGQVIL